VSTVEIRLADPLDERVSGLIRRQLEFGHAASPPEAVHALDFDDLLDPGIVLFAAHDDDEVLAVGALKEIDGGHGEIKTMHTAERARGRGLGRAMLDRLLAEARLRGYRRVSLETGAMEAFGPARSLYRGAGFSTCGPFGDYRSSPHSVYMTLLLDEPA
jgi:putative acetyltransferase